MILKWSTAPQLSSDHCAVEERLQKPNVPYNRVDGERPSDFMRLNPIPIVFRSSCSWERDFKKLMDLTIESWWRETKWFYEAQPHPNSLNIIVQLGERLHKTYGLYNRVDWERPSDFIMLNPIPIVFRSSCSWERDYEKLMNLTIELLQINAKTIEPYSKHIFALITIKILFYVFNSIK